MNFKLRKEHYALGLILLLGFILRMYGLNFQSLWYDELHTMVQADPGRSLQEFFRYSICCDQHPPLHYLLSRYSFEWLGYNAFVARLISVVAGTLGIYVVFLLGKELKNSQVGLIASALTCVNYFHLYYSQEARSYAMLFLFSAMAFLYTTYLIKTPNFRHGVKWGIVNAVLLYTHYYGLFVFGSQLLVLGMYWAYSNHGYKKMLLKSTALGLVLSIVLFLPWIQQVVGMVELKSYWIPEIQIRFLYDYFFMYFGYSSPILYAIVMLLVVYLSSKINSIKAFEIHLKNRDPEFLALLIFVSIGISVYIIPYIYSSIRVPILYSRYTIGALPFILLAAAFAIYSIQHKRIRYLLFLGLLGYSLIDVVVLKKYYFTPTKTDYRGVVAYLNQANENRVPVINEVTTNEVDYYERKFGMTGIVTYGSRASVLSFGAQPSSFWLVKRQFEREQDLLPEQKIAEVYRAVFKKDFISLSLVFYKQKEESNGPSTQLEAVVDKEGVIQ
ncbi:MAG: glycosyltransferase family 39 protein [Flavobacteriales bacterium]|nr:glycosyltransferase family 39 protein [Flavobacteriales bacterium]